MDNTKPSYKVVGAPCGHHGQYTFYKALRLCGTSGGSHDRIVAIGDFFFVRVWQDSELVSVGELQLLWTDRVSDQTLVSLRLYFLPENTPDGRGLHGEDEVLAISDKVVLKAEDMLSWVCDGDGWGWGLRAVWRGACAPPPASAPDAGAPGSTAPLHCSRLDFSDVDKEKSAIVDADYPGVVVFSYPRYCRYRALLSRLEGVQADWLRDSLVAALGGYAAPTRNTRILYCKDTFEYPELEGHVFVCNHLAPRLKGRPRGRRGRRVRSRSHSSDRTSDSDSGRSATPHDMQTPTKAPITRIALEKIRADVKLEKVEKIEKIEKLEDRKPKKETENAAEDRAFVRQLKAFYKGRNQTLKLGHSMKELSLRSLYRCVMSRGGHAAVSSARAWPHVAAVCRTGRAAHLATYYERVLLQLELYERRNGTRLHNGDETRRRARQHASPLRDLEPGTRTVDVKGYRTPSPPAAFDLSNPLSDTGDPDVVEVTSKPAELLNQEFLDSLPSADCGDRVARAASPVQASLLAGQLRATDITRVEKDETACFGALSGMRALSDKYTGHTLNNGQNGVIEQKVSHRPGGARSSLRSVRVKPTASRDRDRRAVNHTSGLPPLRADSASASASSSPVTIPTCGAVAQPPPVLDVPSDDEIVEVPYRPKTPEIIDLDEYPESPQSLKKKKLDILKERGLEVTAIPNTWSTSNPVLANPLTPTMLMNPAMQHQIMTQAQLFQMYNIMPQNYPNGVQPPKVIQGKSIFGSCGPEKTVYGNPKDPFMPPPHILQGVPIKPTRNVQPLPPLPHDVLDLTCGRTQSGPSKPTVEIVRVPNTPTLSPSPQNLAKNYTLVDGKAVVGSNLEITLVSPKQSPNKSQRPPQKRSSNGKFMSNKTSTPPRESYAKSYPSPVQNSVTTTSRGDRKSSSIVVPSYQVNLSRDEASPTSSTSSRDGSVQGVPVAGNILQNVFKNPPVGAGMMMMDLQNKNPVSNLTPLMDPVYMSALYNSLAGQLDQRQLAVYREFMAGQFRGYSGLLSMGAITNTPTTKN